MIWSGGLKYDGPWPEPSHSRAPVAKPLIMPDTEGTFEGAFAFGFTKVHFSQGKIPFQISTVVAGEGTVAMLLLTRLEFSEGGPPSNGANSNAMSTMPWTWNGMDV
ncbi:hypothetical protein BT93_C2294 [Corymbia citriodora subsp. variegata]|nr:hypothetical protein BT93_C2294 [Corymbia citriodora subsp. variegata]